MKEEEKALSVKKIIPAGQLSSQSCENEGRMTYFSPEKQIITHSLIPTTNGNLNLLGPESHKSEELLQAVLQAFPGAKFLLTNEGAFLHCYPSPEVDNFIPGAKDFKGQKISSVFPPYIAQAILSNIKKSIIQKDVQTIEFKLSLNGAMRHFETRFNLISDNKVIAIFNDITGIKNTQETLKEHLNELDEKNRQLKKYIDSNLQLENFAYIASHDLREPLRTIRNFAELLKNRYADQLDETAINHINLIVSGTSQMNSLVEDLLTYSRVNTENHSFEPTNVKDLLNEVLNGLENYIEESGTTVTVQELPESINANPTKMKQLLLNLITNAIKFRKPEVPAKILISMKNLGEYWKLNVADNGMGIRKEFQKQIFMLFKKLHTSGEHPGTGLGLAICQKIIEQHEGNIWVESQEGKGAVFCCTIKKNLKPDAEH
jgi:signal transduction histidine kinase